MSGEPALRGAGGSGFEVIWCVASVMPYDSMTGAPNVSSSACITCGGKDAEEERINLSGAASITALLRSARARIAWCIVGTAVYQVGRASLIQLKKRNASNPGAHQIDPPAASEAETAAISPWIWNSGMMFRQSSVSLKPKSKALIR